MSDYGEPPSSDGSRRTGWAELGSGETVELARPGQRCGARVLDVIILMVINFVLALFSLGPSGDLVDPSESYGTFFVASLLGSAVFLAYEVVQVAVWGQTLGKRMVGVKVVNAARGGLPTWGNAVGRGAIPGLVWLIPWIGPLAALLCYLSLTWDRVYQGWHDKTGGTLVIRQ